MIEQYTITGTLSNQTTVILDEPVSLPAGRVKITVERLPDSAFWQEANVEQLAMAQQVRPIQRLDDLWGDFWPEDESIDDFIATIRAWRDEDSEL